MTQNEFVHWSRKTKFRHSLPIKSDAVDIFFSSELRLTSAELGCFPDGMALENMLRAIAEYCEAYVVEAKERILVELKEGLREREPKRKGPDEEE